MEQRILITKAKSGVFTTAFHEFTVSSQDCHKVLGRLGRFRRRKNCYRTAEEMISHLDL